MYAALRSSRKKNFLFFLQQILLDKIKMLGQDREDSEEVSDRFFSWNFKSTSECVLAFRTTRFVQLLKLIYQMCVPVFQMSYPSPRSRRNLW
jgi:hypothetical protein